MSIELPDLNAYKESILNSGGTIYPLAKIHVPEDGLLNSLPSAPADKKGWPWNSQVAPSIYAKNIKWPKLTIVTPSYNQGRFLEETIRSVLLQNYPNLEYIIIDGGSTDNTVDIIQKYSRWISYWQSKKDNGQSHAINLGFSLSSGDYLAWINSDDHYEVNTFEMVMSVFSKTNTKFVYGYGYTHDQQGHLKLIKTAPVLDYFLRIPSLLQPSCFWSRSIHVPIWEALECSMDYELWIRMLRGNKRKLIRKSLSISKIHNEAKTSNPAMDKAWANDHKLICSKDAHGPVYNWKNLAFMNKLYTALCKIL